jgi:hypothetical protein
MPLGADALQPLDVSRALEMSYRAMPPFLYVLSWTNGSSDSFLAGLVFTTLLKHTCLG